MRMTSPADELRQGGCYIYLYTSTKYEYTVLVMLVCIVFVNVVALQYIVLVQSYAVLK